MLHIYGCMMMKPQIESRLKMNLGKFPESHDAVRPLLKRIQNVLKEENVLVQMYKTAWRQLYGDDGKGDIKTELYLKIKGNVKPPNGEHKKNYCKPTENNGKCGTLFQVRTTDPEKPTKQEIILIPEEVSDAHDAIEDSKHIYRTIYHDHELWDPLCFPMLFPRGLPTYNGLLRQSDPKITPKKFYKYHIFHRIGKWNPIHNAAFLGQQFWCSAYSKVFLTEMEQRKSTKIQKRMRASTYQKVKTAKEQNKENQEIGRKMNILPSTVRGSPRWYKKQAQNALALTESLGKIPDLFLTVTANPKWREVEEELAHFPNQSAKDRDDLIARVFRGRLKKLLEKIKNGALGFHISHCYSIEFQKRGLVHAHILIFLHPNCSPTRNSSEYDELVSAEIPDEKTHPKLYDLVKKYMVHGPCSRRANCLMSNGCCKKFFPKDFCDYTQYQENSYPKYKRPNNGRYFWHEKYPAFCVDNRWIIPYNPAILLAWEGHANIESVVNIEVIEYLFKYLFKGRDKGMAQFEDVAKVLEIDDFIDGYWFGACEAVWQLLGHRIAYQYPACKSISVHLPNQQPAYFLENDQTDDEDNDEDAMEIDEMNVHPKQKKKKKKFNTKNQINEKWMQRMTQMMKKTQM